jgi:hypothetical protein
VNVNALECEVCEMVAPANAATHGWRGIVALAGPGRAFPLIEADADVLCPRCGRLDDEIRQLLPSCRRSMGSRRAHDRYDADALLAGVPGELGSLEELERLLRTWAELNSGELVGRLMPRRPGVRGGGERAGDRQVALSLHLPRAVDDDSDTLSGPPAA